MAPEGQVGQKEMKYIVKFEKYFHMSQCHSGERYGPWGSCFKLIKLSSLKHMHVYAFDLYTNSFRQQRIIDQT
jgi:hypothetical protein